MGRFKSPHTAVSQVQTDWKWALSAQLCIIWSRITVTEWCDFKRKQRTVSTNLRQHILAFFFFFRLHKNVLYTCECSGFVNSFSTFLFKCPGLGIITWREMQVFVEKLRNKLKFWVGASVFLSRGNGKTVFHVGTCLLCTREIAGRKPAARLDTITALITCNALHGEVRLRLLQRGWTG